MSSRPFGTPLLASALFLAAYPALPCQLIPAAFHQINPELRGVDVTPPNPPQVSAAALERRLGESCQGGVCVSNSCGNLATLSIELVAGEDDLTLSSELGYRLEVLEGEIPESLRDQLVLARRASGGQLLYRPAFEDAALLDASLFLVAIDAAGNESAPSPAFRVQFDGCTRSALNDECDASGEASVASCAVSGPGPARAGAGGAAILGAVALLCLGALRLGGRCRQRT